MAQIDLIRPNYGESNSEKRSRKKKSGLGLLSGLLAVAGTVASGGAAAPWLLGGALAAGLSSQFVKPGKPNDAPDLGTTGQNSKLAQPLQMSTPENAMTRRMSKSNPQFSDGEVINKFVEAEKELNELRVRDPNLYKQVAPTFYDASLEARRRLGSGIPLMQELREE